MMVRGKFITFEGIDGAGKTTHLGWFRERPQQHSGLNAAERALLGPAAEHDRADAGVAPQATPWAAILFSPTMWAICGQQFFRAAGYIFYATWFPTFLREARGVSLIATCWR